MNGWQEANGWGDQCGEKEKRFWVNYTDYKFNVKG